MCVYSRLFSIMNIEYTCRFKKIIHKLLFVSVKKTLSGSSKFWLKVSYILCVNCVDEVKPGPWNKNLIFNLSFVIYSGDYQL